MTAYGMFSKSQVDVTRRFSNKDEDDLPTLTELFPRMTEKSVNEWLDINVDIDVTQPLLDHDIIRSIQKKEDEGEVDSDNKSNELADEPVTRRQTIDALKILRRAVEPSGGSDEQYTRTLFIE